MVAFRVFARSCNNWFCMVRYTEEWIQYWLSYSGVGLGKEKTVWDFLFPDWCCRCGALGNGTAEAWGLPLSSSNLLTRSARWQLTLQCSDTILWNITHVLPRSSKYTWTVNKIGMLPNHILVCRNISFNHKICNIPPSHLPICYPLVSYSFSWVLGCPHSSRISSFFPKPYGLEVQAASPVFFAFLMVIS